MTRLVASLLFDGPAATVAAGQAALTQGADLIEIRLDGWADSEAPVDPVVEGLPAERSIITCRSAAEGGGWPGDTQRRVARLIEAARQGAAYIDFEYADWRRSANIRQKVRLAAADQTPGRLILSSHHFMGRPGDPAKLLADMARERGLAAVKLAWRAEDIGDNLLAFDLVRGSAVPAVVLCMGEAGLMSRVLAGKVGAFATYCAPATGGETAPGQLTLADMLDRYRWRSIDQDTQVFGVVGCPVVHSASPPVFNACFERHHVNAVYLPLLVDPAEGVLQRFLAGCARRPWLHARGFSVTIPHKEEAARYVGERIDPLARQIGAVNTLVADGDSYRGYNTDCAGALDAIVEALGCEPNDLAGMDVAVLGAGGAARAVVAGLRRHGASVTLYNRRLDRARALAGEFGCRVGPWEQRSAAGKSGLLVNCTSVGLWPAVDESPLPPDALNAATVVFDTVYNPAETCLLRDARGAGCRTIDGLTMFVNQAAAQFEVWTGLQPDKGFLRRVAQTALGSAGASVRG